MKIAPSFLDLADNIKNREKSTESRFSLSKTNAPSFGASALVAQKTISSNNEENYHNLSSGFLVGHNTKKFSEVVAVHKKFYFWNNTVARMDALEAFARLGLPKEPQNKEIKRQNGENKSTYASFDALLQYALL